jgi:hypothetical protein
MGYPGQQFAHGDLPHSDLKSCNFTGDFPGESAKCSYVRVNGNNGIRRGITKESLLPGTEIVVDDTNRKTAAAAPTTAT